MRNFVFHTLRCGYILHTELDFKTAISHILKYDSIEFHNVAAILQSIKCNTATTLNITVLHLTCHTITSFYLVQERHKSK